MEEIFCSYEDLARKPFIAREGIRDVNQFTERRGNHACFNCTAECGKLNHRKVSFVVPSTLLCLPKQQRGFPCFNVLSLVFYPFYKKLYKFWFLSILCKIGFVTYLINRFNSILPLSYYSLPPTILGLVGDCT